MTIRTLSFVLLVGASFAFAAPPKSAPPTTPPSEQPPDSIDVDAIARAKDANGAQPADADAPVDAPTPAAAPSEVPSTAPSEAPVTETPAPPVESPAAASEAAPNTDAPSAMSAAPAEIAAPAGTAAPAMQAESVEAPAKSASSDSLEAPPKPTPAESAERSIAAGCAARAASLLDDAAKADYGNATRDFNAKMRTDMPAPKFKQQWESLAQFGKLVARGQSHLGTGEGYTLVMIPLIFEKTNLVAQIACGSDGRIAGFHVTQAPKPQF